METSFAYAQPQVSLRVPFSASAVADVRRNLHDWLDHQGAPGERIDDARVVVSEMLGNAVRHAQPLPDGTLAVRWELHKGDLHLAVSDGGGHTTPHPVHAPLSATSGRGMAIIEMLASRWWLEHGPGRTTVHTVLPVC